MKPVLFTLVALMTVIPFLFMLPLGLSRRGKIVALVVSLLLSLLAVMAKSAFPLWQLGLLLLLLAMAMTYLLDRQLGHVLYAAAKEEEDEDDYDPFLFHVQNETNAAAEEQEVVPRHDDVILPTESMVPVEEQPSIEPLEKEEILKEPLLSNDETNAELLENDDDIQFLEHRFELLDDIVKDETKQEKHDSFAGEEPFFVEAEAASLLEVDEIEDKAFPEQEMMEPLPNDEWLSEWHPVDEQAEEAMAVEALPDIEIVQHTAAGNKSPLQKQLLHTVITELQLSRKHLEKAEYERRIHQCLHPHLPDDDYYAFARLLIEHYLLEKDHDKLASCLAHLQEKFAHYPILLKEIQFLHHTLMKS